MKFIKEVRKLGEALESFEELLAEGYCYEDLAYRGENVYEAASTVYSIIINKGLLQRED